MSGQRLSLLSFCLATILWTVAAVAQQPTPTPTPVPAPAAAPTLVTPTPPAIALSVEDAVTFALQNNPAIASSAENVAIAEAQVVSARAAGRPTLTVNSTTVYNPAPASITLPGAAGKPDTTIQLSSMFTSSVQVTGSQPVWPNTRWRAPIAAAQANVGVNETTLTRTRQQIAFQVRQAYFQLLSAQQLQQVSADAVTVAEGQLKLAQNTFEAGTAPKLDVVQATAALESARVNLLRAQNATDIAQAGLAIQLGLPAGTKLALAPPRTLPTAPDAIEPLVQTAFAQRPELTQLNYRREQLKANIALIKLQQQPLANVQASYGDTLLGTGGLGGGQNMTVSLNVALAVYNGDKTKPDLQAAQLQLEQLNTTAQQLELGITMDIRQAVLNLQNASAQQSAAQRQLDAANQALEIAQLRYNYGEGIFLEVQQGQLNQTQARTALAQAQFQAYLAAAQLDFALGASPTTMQ